MLKNLKARKACTIPSPLTWPYSKKSDDTQMFATTGLAYCCNQVNRTHRSYYPSGGPSWVRVSESPQVKLPATVRCQRRGQQRRQDALIYMSNADV